MLPEEDLSPASADEWKNTIDRKYDPLQRQDETGGQLLSPTCSFRQIITVFKQNSVSVSHMH